MICKRCGKNTNTVYHTCKKLSDKGFPTHAKEYATAHEEASKEEKKKFPNKNYDKLKKMDEDFPKGELIGKNSQSGKISVSKKVPKKLRSEVAFHEKFENEILRKKK